MSTHSIPTNADPVLKVENLGKAYARKAIDVRKKLGRSAWRAIFHLPPSKTASLTGSQFWAVDSVSFELTRGEALGIIGLNGSGKTTLLRMLAGQIPPDSGEFQLRGTSAAMIDLQAGFQPQASGYENIFLRAAALGFTRKETQSHLQQIMIFSELGEALDAPMATYSSGMRMRLAFSVMAIVAPDVLFIDEVLAVGDFRFRQKCLAKVREMREQAAFVFVSHSMSDIKAFCDRVIVMHKGVMHFIGAPEKAIEIYESLDSGTVELEPDQKLKSAMGPEFENVSAISDVEHYWCDPTGERVETIPFGSPFALHMKFRSNIDVRNLIVGVPVWALNTHYTTGLSTQIDSEPFDVRAGQNVELVVDVEGGYLNPGKLKSVLSILDGPEFLFRQENPDLNIERGSHPTWGAITVPHTWRRVDKETDESGTVHKIRLRS